LGFFFWRLKPALADPTLSSLDPHSLKRKAASKKYFFSIKEIVEYLRIKAHRTKGAFLERLDKTAVSIMARWGDSSSA
jgi:hypothetical protein